MTEPQGRSTPTHKRTLLSLFVLAGYCVLALGSTEDFRSGLQDGWDSNFGDSSAEPDADVDLVPEASLEMMGVASPDEVEAVVEATIAELSDAEVGVGESASNPLHKVRDGLPIQPDDLAGLSCKELWAARNWIYARHGYAFKTSRATDYFSADPAYRRDESVTAQTILSSMSDTDAANRDVIIAAEKLNGCNN